MYGQCSVAATWTNPNPWIISLGPGCFCVPLVWAVASVAGHCFGPGGFHAPPVVADGSEAGHRFQILFWFRRICTDHCNDLFSLFFSLFFLLSPLIAFDLLLNFFTTKNGFSGVFFRFSFYVFCFYPLQGYSRS